MYGEKGGKMEDTKGRIVIIRRECVITRTISVDNLKVNYDAYMHAHRYKSTSSGFLEKTTSDQTINAQDKRIKGKRRTQSILDRGEPYGTYGWYTAGR